MNILREKKNIIVFHPYPKAGGADRSIINLINGLTYSRIFFISIFKCKYKEKFERKINFIPLKSKRVFFGMNELKKIVIKIIQENNFSKNILISNQNFANVTCVVSLNNIKNLKLILIERNHINELFYFKGIKDFIKKIIILIGIKLFYRKANSIVGISKTLSKDLSHFIKQEVTTIYNPAYNRIEFEKKKFKIKKKGIRLLNVGFLEKQKDQTTLLKAFHIVLKLFPNCHLDIVGRGSQYKNLMLLAKKLKIQDNIKIFTNIDNPEIFYKNCDLFILTSIYEGFANVLVESLKFQCPTITANCKSGPMEIIDNGKYGHYFSVSNYTELSKKIINHLKRPYILKAKSIASKKHIKKFSFKNNSIEFNNLINQI